MRLLSQLWMTGSAGADIIRFQDESIDFGQREWLKEALAQEGLKVRRRSMTGEYISTGWQHSNFTNAVKAAKAMTAHFGYATVQLQSHDAAHMIGIAYDGDVVFFDPNYGEFWFPDRNAFIAWFKTLHIEDYRLDWHKMRVTFFYNANLYGETASVPGRRKAEPGLAIEAR